MTQTPQTKPPTPTPEPEVIQLLFFKNNPNPIISRIDDVGSEIGEPDCRLTKPYEIVEGELVPWLARLTDQRQFMIHSDSILTMANPNDTLLKKYKEKLL